MERRWLLKAAGALLAPGGGILGSGWTESCEYRAKASVLLLSIPLLHRDHVGAGFLRVAEDGDRVDRRLLMEFGAGSIPEHAAGLNRMGLFEESVVEREGRLHCADYFGYMTSSPEENLEQAKAVLERGTAAGISAIRGRIGEGRIVNRLARLSGLRHQGWARWREVTVEVRARLEQESGREVECSAAGGEEVSTFLYAVRGAMRDESPGTRRFVHNGEILCLRTEPSNANGGVVCVSGKIAKASGKQTGAFRLWHERGSTLPLRFEFRPRSFLRLTFERVAS
ncbi:MAG: hypothetical protein R2729_09555 [Bryobacteraceae bacterium]